MSYLVHYGIKGMKWGVRRYQNADGTLTDSGKKRYLRGGNERYYDRAYKDFEKAIISKRAEYRGKDKAREQFSPIGVNSESFLNEQKRKKFDWENSPSYKKWEAKRDKFLDEWEKQGSNSAKEGEFIARYNRILGEEPIPKSSKSKYYTYSNISKAGTKKGKGYAFNFAKKGGMDLSIAYLKDLGFNDETSKHIAEALLKEDYTLGGA